MSNPIKNGLTLKDVETSAPTAEDCVRLLNEVSAPRRLLHYYSPKAPFAPALCGESAPADSWASVPNGDAVTVAGYPLYEVCPACQVRFSALTSGSIQDGGAR